MAVFELFKNLISGNWAIIHVVYVRFCGAKSFTLILLLKDAEPLLLLKKLKRTTFERLNSQDSKLPKFEHN